MIVVVSGLPRSGTSMMMKMLSAANIAILTDTIRKADEDNPEGYYEDERVKKLTRDNTWIKEAEGKAVKVISYLLPQLPKTHNYNVIFIERSIEEVLASQKKMMHRRGESNDDVPDNVMMDLYRKHLAETLQWLRDQPNFKTLIVSYNETLKNPEFTAEKVAKFLEKDLDIEKMMQVINPNLYRQRKP